MADSDRKSGNFTVTDRRAFDASGERKEDAPTADKPSELASPGAAASGAGQPAEREAARALPPADFATLVLSLGSSAVAYMGEAPAGTGTDKMPARNLPMAKHAIDLLSVLEEKTKGNLSPEEQQILESLLFDLRLRYVEAVKPGSKGG
jgi:hypothetical protein